MSRLAGILLATVILGPGQAMADGDWLLNQAGYESGKMLRLLKVSTGKEEDGKLRLVEQRTGRVIQDRPPYSRRLDTDSGMVLVEYRLDAPHQSGLYRLESDQGASPEFEVGSGRYQSLMRLLLRSFFLQRCGVALKDPETGLEHGVDHASDGVIFRSDSLNSKGASLEASGGWHDAGDYGKYVPTTTVTIGRLLEAYSRVPWLFVDGQLGIPESGNRIPDVLDEAAWGLDWLLKMQREDGAVYRKVSGERWPSAQPPDEDRQLRYVYGVSSADTAKFAAVMAQASRLYGELNPVLSTQYRDAAERAWRWLEQVKEPLLLDRKPEDDSGSGRYHYSETDREPSLLTDRDDRLWAASELWLLTRESRYLDYLKAETYFSRHPVIYEWKNPALLGLVHLLRDNSEGLPDDLRENIRKAVLVRALQAMDRVRSSGFGVANDRFVWGSNKMAAEEGWFMAEAYQMTGNKEYLVSAQIQLDYLLGSNPQGISFVTGVGENRVRRTAHLFARAAARDIPGLLVGGANDLAQDGIAPRGKGILSYLDNERAYSVNEYAIDYNASLIGLLSALERAWNSTKHDESKGGEG